MAFVDPPNRNYSISPGLNMVCSVFSANGIQKPGAKTLSIDFDAEMRKLTQIERDACPTASGFLAGWRSLLTLYPRIPLSPLLLDDVAKCIEVYERIRPGVITATPTYFHITISRDPNQLSLETVPPKVIGGTVWTLNNEYKQIQRNWLNAGFPPMTPCIAFGWPGVQRKVISRNHLSDCDALMLLTTVDYDLDRNAAYHSAFLHAMQIGRHWISVDDTRMQSTALTAFLGLDVQVNVRTVQESWIANAAGGNLGPDDVGAADWVSTLIGDCGVFSACGYEDQKCYTKTRTGLFTAVAMGNVHDILYDIATCNRLSSGLYASAAGVSEFDLHCAFITTMTDMVAHRVLSSNPEDVPLFGNNTLLLTGPWILFTERYRTWERFIKYMRILRHSDSPKAQNILNMARRQMVLDGCDVDDVDEAWRKATTKGSETSLTPRITVAYPIAASPEMARIPGLLQPDLCSCCMARFQQTLLSSKTDVFHGIPGLSTRVITCSAVARAAAIRRVALYASGDACCDGCACRIGRWADVAGYMVCGALMGNELATSASDWLLQCYVTWVVSISPVSVMTVLSGFDLLSNVRCEDGSMGNRDVLDKWEAGVKGIPTPNVLN